MENSGSSPSDLGIIVDQTTQALPASHSTEAVEGDCGIVENRVRRSKHKAPVWPPLVVVRDVFSENSLEVTDSPDEEVVEDLGADPKNPVGFKQWADRREQHLRGRNSRSMALSRTRGP